MKKGIRHGDMALIQAKLPKGLKDSKSNILLDSGSGGHTHSFTGGTFYPKVDGDFIIGYLKAKNITLFHPEHGKGKGVLKEVKILDGVYEIRKQVEYLHDGMREVVD